MNAFYLQKASKTASFKILIGSIYDLLIILIGSFWYVCPIYSLPILQSLCPTADTRACLSVYLCLSFCLNLFVSLCLNVCFPVYIYYVCLCFFFMFIYKRKRVILPKYDPWTFFRNTEKIEQVTFLNLIFSETELQRSVWVIEMCLLLLMLFELFG